MYQKRFIIHIDMDAFFASIEQRDNPQFRGRPVVVGADPKNGKGRGVVSTCSYEARKYGIHSAMPISIAYRKCPNAVFLPVDIEKYRNVSQEIYGIFNNFSPDVEGMSIDEAFIDITSTYKLFGSPFEACVLLKSRIREEINLTASIGLAPTKMAAKIASDLKKPDGLVEVKQEGLLNFLWPLDVEKIWGLGEKGKEILNPLGIKTIGDLAKEDFGKIIKLFGKNGIRLWQLANGIDESEVETETETKSVSREITFAKDTLDKEEILGSLMGLCEKLSQRLRQERLKAQTITLKIRLEGFDTYTRSVTISNPTNFVEVFCKQIRRLYNNFEFKNKRVRLVGVGLSNLCPVDFKYSLFEDKDDIKREAVHKAVDKIIQKFGDLSIFRAASRV